VRAILGKPLGLDASAAASAAALEAKAMRALSYAFVALVSPRLSRGEELRPAPPEALCDRGTQLPFETHKVTEFPWGVQGIHALDLDQDGDMDVVSAAYTGDDVSWHENDGNQGFTDHLVSGNEDGTTCAYAVDIDADGDYDIVYTAYMDDRIAWFENDGTQTFTKHIIDSAEPRPPRVSMFERLRRGKRHDIDSVGRRR
jgi:hypothetical protein